MMAQYKRILKFIPLLILPSAIFFFLGHTKWAILSLGLIPLFVLHWEAYISLCSDEAKKLREISKRLTDAEQRQFKKLSRVYGAKCGVLFGVTPAGMNLILGGVFGVEDLLYLIMGMLVGLVIVFPLTLRFRKSLAHFLSSTEYAKEQNWSEIGLRR